jgi:hypothetical protein
MADLNYQTWGSQAAFGAKPGTGSFISSSPQHNFALSQQPLAAKKVRADVQAIVGGGLKLQIARVQRPQGQGHQR